MMNHTNRDKLLAELRDIDRPSGTEPESAETFRRAFYPVVEHLRAFEPDIYLIIGYYGTGKSMIFKAAVEQQLSPQMLRGATGNTSLLHSLARDQISWRTGYPSGADVAQALRNFAKQRTDRQDGPLILADVWLAYLARQLRFELHTESLYTFHTLSDSAVDDMYAVLQPQRTAVMNALDRLDMQMRNEGRWIFVCYDELDTLCGADWELTTALIRGLLTFWEEHRSRWQRLQAKIFLRTDLFTRFVKSDFARLAANRIELIWNDRSLHAIWIKRLANVSSDWLAYCKNAGIRFEHDQILGWIPHLPNAEAAQPLIEKMVGPFMGRDLKKSRTSTWILDHLRDGNEQVALRALISLWSYAAAQELDKPQASSEQLIHPMSLQRAFDQVSKMYVQMLKNRDMPWLEGLIKRLANQEVPLSREGWLNILSKDWERWCNDPSEKLHPPRKTPSEFLDFLIELGMCRKRPDDQLDVPDLFLRGLALKRRGGVKS
ncbi:MAG: hypothetical protein WHS83_10330 [Chloroflexus sp.]|jgi:hypothetical protein|uniref:hypothetical protein n=1 Tax=Chloroflexus sp. TaxID=1904827 RepID=UPI00309A9B69